MWLVRICVLFLCGLGSCASSDILKGDAFLENNVRVYIRIDSLDIPEKAKDADLEKLFIEKGSYRFKDLMTALGSETGKTEYIGGVLNKVSAPKIVYSRENEYYAEAIIDFTVPIEVFKIYKEKYPSPKFDENAE